MNIPENISNLIKRYPTKNNLQALIEVSKDEPAKKKVKVVDTGITIEQELLFQIKAIKLKEPVPEYRFHDKRKWRIDLAWVEEKIAVEIEGRDHRMNNRYKKDVEKYNTLSSMGWRLLRFLPVQVHSGEALGEIEKLLKGV